MLRQSCLKRKKDASEAQEPCHSGAGWFEPTQPYCFSRPGLRKHDHECPGRARSRQGNSCTIRVYANLDLKLTTYTTLVQGGPFFKDTYRAHFKLRYASSTNTKKLGVHLLHHAHSLTWTCQLMTDHLPYFPVSSSMKDNHFKYKNYLFF